jgi:hypothetical protein
MLVIKSSRNDYRAKYRHGRGQRGLGRLINLGFRDARGRSRCRHSCDSHSSRDAPCARPSSRVFLRSMANAPCLTDGFKLRFELLLIVLILQHEGELGPNAWPLGVAATCTLYESTRVQLLPVYYKTRIQQGLSHKIQQGRYIRLGVSTRSRYSTYS